MEQPDKVMLTHESLGGYDNYLGDYLIVIESKNGKILRVYSVERPPWHKYFDKEYPYNPLSLN